MLSFFPSRAQDIVSPEREFIGRCITQMLSAGEPLAFFNAPAE